MQSLVQAETGPTRIQAAFRRAREEGRAALIVYLTLGHPSPEASLACVEAAVRAGADLVELGIPFSDPLADGPTIQAAAQRALAQGITPRRCLEMAAELRRRGVGVPLLFMGYLNPILAFGVEAFARESRRAGVDGWIVPDLPPEEGEEVEAVARKAGLALVYLAAPTTPLERLAWIARRTAGFLYLVSLTGVTGDRERLPPGLAARIAAAKGVVDGVPLAVGFGIRGPEQAAAVARQADGVVVGSAVVRRAAEGPEAVAAFVGALRSAVG